MKFYNTFATKKHDYSLFIKKKFLPLLQSFFLEIINKHDFSVQKFNKNSLKRKLNSF